MPLAKSKKYDLDEQKEMVICSCRRMFIYDGATDTYRRATLREAKVFARNQ
jgi:hypothetical protein